MFTDIEKDSMTVSDFNLGVFKVYVGLKDTLRPEDLKVLQIVVLQGDHPFLSADPDTSDFTEELKEADSPFMKS